MNKGKKSTSRVYRKADKNKKKKHGHMHKTCLVLVSICLFFVLFHLIGDRKAETPVVYAEAHLSELQYKIIEIEQGDTLWQIASEHMSPGYSDIHDYIDEIKVCNQLHSDQITAGSYLMLPYYEVMQNDTVIASKN